MLPFEIISTQELMIHHEEQHEERHDSSSSSKQQKSFSPWINQEQQSHFASSSYRKDEMDDKTASKLLSYIEKHSRYSQSSSSSSSRSHSSRSRNKSHQLPSHMAQSLPEPSNKTDLSSSVANFFGVTTKEMVKNMTKDDFIDYGLTIRKLLKLKIAISDMKNAGILNTFDDILDMGFRIQDLTYDRKLFKVDQLYMLYHIDYHQLIDCNRVDFNIYTLIETKFDSLELQALSFSFDDFIGRRLMSKRHFERLDYSLNDCINNGLSIDGIKKLDISRKDIANYGWSQEIKEFDNIIKQGT